MDKTTKSMTVAELKKWLSKMPNDREVVLSSDPEGNSFGTIENSADSFALEDGMLFIYPLEQFTDWN